MSQEKDKGEDKEMKADGRGLEGRHRNQGEKKREDRDDSSNCCREESRERERRKKRERK